MKTLRFFLVGKKSSCVPRAVAGLCGLLFGFASAFAQTWTPVAAPFLNWESVASSADGLKCVAVASFGPVHRSTNSGEIWFATTTAPSTPYLVSGASSADGTKLAATSYDWVHNSGGVSVSTNSGTTWINLYSLLGLSVAISADGSKFVLAGCGSYAGTGAIQISTNWGNTWWAASAPITNWSCVAISADGSKMFAGASKHGGPFWSEISGPIYRALDSGATWTPTGSPEAVWTSIASSADGTLLAAAGSGSVYTSTDAGATWVSNNVPGPGMVSVASSADGSKLAAAGFGGIFSSTNSGASWSQSSAPVTNWTSISSSADGNKRVAAVNGGGIYTWQSTPGPTLNITRAAGNAVISWIVPSTEFVLQQNHDLVTTNWTDVPATPTLNLTNLNNELIISPSSGNRFYRLKH